MWRALLLAAAERLIKTLLVGRSIHSTMVQNEPPSPLFLAAGAGWLAVRYVAAAHRHIYALRAGLGATVHDLRRRQTLALAGEARAPPARLAERFALLRTVGDRTSDATSRWAIDVVPGVISLVVGVAQLLRLLRAPRSWLCAAFLLVSDALHCFLCQRQAVREDDMDRRHQATVARTYSIAQQSIQNHETVMLFDRQHCEIQRLDKACLAMTECHAQWARCWNLQGSLRHWVAHLQTGTMLWLAHGYLEHAAELVVVLFYAGEVQRGLDELRNYQRVLRMHRAADDALRRTEAPPPVSRITCAASKDGSVRLDRVTVELGGRAVLQHISLDLHPGQRVALLGTNGSGKTSLLRILQRYRLAGTGAVSAPPAHTVLACTQEPQLFANASVPYNAAYGCHAGRTVDPACTTWKAFGPHVEQAAEMLEVAHLAEADVAALSGGERQRLGLVRILAAALERPSEVKLLLLDEHDSALDCGGKSLARRAVADIHQRTGCTVLSITHVAAGDYDRALVLRNGTLVADGSWSTVSRTFFEIAAYQ